MLLCFMFKNNIFIKDRYEKKSSKEDIVNKKRLNRKRRAADAINENYHNSDVTKSTHHRKLQDGVDPHTQAHSNTQEDSILPLSPIKTFPPQAPSTSSSTMPPPYSFASPKDLYKIAPSGIRPQSGDPLPRNGRNGVAKGLVMDTRGNFKMHYANDGRGPPQRTSVLFGDSPIKDAKVSHSIIRYYTQKIKMSICTSIHIC